jgi:hypothetical protein
MTMGTDVKDDSGARLEFRLKMRDLETLKIAFDVIENKMRSYRSLVKTNFDLFNIQEP